MFGILSQEQLIPYQIQAIFGVPHVRDGVIKTRVCGRPEKILRGEGMRTVGLSEVLAAAALIAQCAQLAAQFWQGRRDRDALLKFLAAEADAPKPIGPGVRGAIIGITVSKIAEVEATNQNISRSVAQASDQGMARTTQEFMVECLGNELTRGSCYSTVTDFARLRG